MLFGFWFTFVCFILCCLVWICSWLRCEKYSPDVYNNKQNTKNVFNSKRLVGKQQIIWMGFCACLLYLGVAAVLLDSNLNLISLVIILFGSCLFCISVIREFISRGFLWNCNIKLPVEFKQIIVKLLYLGIVLFGITLCVFAGI